MTEKWKPPEENPLHFVCPKCKRPTTRNQIEDIQICVVADSDQCRYAELLNRREEVAELRALNGELKEQLSDQKLRQDIVRRSRITSTHTFAVLEVSALTMTEINRKLHDAGYEHSFSRDDDGRPLIDMHGIALRKGDG